MIDSKIAVRPLFGLASVGCLVLCLPAVWVTVRLFSSSQDFLGHHGMAVALVTLLASWVMGSILGGVGIWRRERPRLFALLGCVMNSAGIGWVLLR